MPTGGAAQVVEGRSLVLTQSLSLTKGQLEQHSLSVAFLTEDSGGFELGPSDVIFWLNSGSTLRARPSQMDGWMNE